MTIPFPFTELSRSRRSSLGQFARAAARLPSIIGAPPGFPAIIENLRVVVVGAGAVGGAAAIQLARMQPAELYLIDPKRFKRESVLTQPIGPGAIGKSKAMHIGRVCKVLSPATKVFAFEGGIEAVDTALLRGAHAILLATDNLDAEVEASQKALHLAVPLIHGAVHGDTLVAQVRTLANRDGQGACLACGFSQAEWALLAQGVRYPCDPGTQQENARLPVEAQPTFSIPSLCSLAASLMIMHLLKVCIGFGQSVTETIYQYCAHTGKTVASPLTRNPDCPCDHTPWQFVSSVAALEASSPAQLAQSAGMPSTVEDPPLFSIPGFEWVDSLQCAVGHTQPLHSFLPRGERAAAPCPVCGKPLHPTPMSRQQAVSAITMGAQVNAPLAKLGVTNASRIHLRSLTKTILLEASPQPVSPE